VRAISTATIIVTQIAPGRRDIVVYKQKPSGFFGSNLASYLTLLGCDGRDRHRHHHLGLRARTVIDPSASTIGSRSPRRLLRPLRKRATLSISAT